MLNKSRPGLNLIEMSIVLVLALGILTAIVTAYSEIVKAYSADYNKSTLIYNGSNALTTMAKDIRQSRKVLTAGSGSIVLWYQDLNSNYTVEAAETLSYSLTGSKLTRTSSTEAVNLAAQVASLSFSYDNFTNPKLVQVDLTLGSGGSTITLESKARLRNVD